MERTIRVNVRMQRYAPLLLCFILLRRSRHGDKECLGGFDGVFFGESETQAIGLVGVDGVGGVKNGEVHRPGVEVGGRDEGNAWWEGVVELCGSDGISLCGSSAGRE